MKVLDMILKEYETILEPVGSNQKNKNKKVATWLRYVVEKPIWSQYKR